jgi:dihydroorotase
MFLIKGGTVYSSSGKKELDIRVHGDKIVEMGRGLEADGEQVVDATGLLVMPGAIDPHVHFRDPGNPEKEDFRTGTEAAVSGGVTFVMDMPNTNPPVIDMESLDAKREIAKEKAVCNFGLYIGATPDNIDQLAELCSQPDVVGVKIYMGSSTGSLLVDKVEYWDQIFQIPGIQVVVHAECEGCILDNMKKFETVEDPEIHSVIRGNDVAETATRQALEIGMKYGTRLNIAHLSTSEELYAVKEYKEKGYDNLTCEVCPHHLIFNLEDYHEKGMFMRVNPPIRSKEDRKALWEDGINLGIVDMLATDHAPHTVEQKDREYKKAASGMPGVEELTPLMLEAIHRGDMTLERFVEMRCLAPARIFKLEKRGDLKEGYFADIALIDFDKEWTITAKEMKSKCGWTNYEGFKVRGKVAKTFVNGQLAYES